MLSDKYILNTLSDAEYRVSDARTCLDSLCEEEFENEETYEEIYDDIIDIGNELYNLETRLNKLRRNLKSTKVLDSEINISRIKSYVYDWIDTFLNNDADELYYRYERKFRNIQNDPRLLNNVALKLKKQMEEANLNFEFDNIGFVSEILYNILTRK